MLVLNTVVSRLNIDELPALVEFARYARYLISFIPLHQPDPANGGDRFSAAADEMTFTPDDGERIDRTFDTLMEMKQEGAWIFNSSLFLKQARAYLKGEQAAARCDAGRLYLSVSPTGIVTPCHRFSEGIPFDAPDFKKRLTSQDFGTRSDEAAASCDGCLKPCWIEISNLFHSPAALLEYIRLLRRRW